MDWEECFPPVPSPKNFFIGRKREAGGQSQFCAKKAFISRMVSMMPTWKGQFFSHTPQ